MFDESFDEYIRSILGYPSTSMGRNMYGMESTMTSMGNNMPNMMSNAMPSTMSNSELEACYPEIYKVVYPMVSTACRNNTRPITKELVDNMTNEIYFAIEGNENVTINLQTGDTNMPAQNRSSNNMNNANNTNNMNASEIKKDNTIPISSGENRGEDRQFGRVQNRTLRDLIRILIIRELLGRPGFPGHRPPMRPPFPGRPPRPPMRPPFPGGPGGRPPMMPRSDFDNYYDIYEN